MKLDDIMAAAPEPSEANAATIGAVVDFVAAAEDLPDEERAAFLTGYLLGMTYVLAKSNEGTIEDAAHDLLRRSAEWEGVIT